MSEESLVNQDTPDETPVDNEAAAAKSLVNQDKVDTTPKQPTTKVDDAASVYDYKAFKTVDGKPFEEAALKSFIPYAKTMGLSQEQAQGVLNMYAVSLQKVKAEQASVQDNKVQAWRDEAINDEEIGGSIFQEKVVEAKRALDVFGNSKLRDLLDDTGLGNNVEVIRFLSKIGKAASDDEFLFGKGGTDMPRDAASILYPDLN